MGAARHLALRGGAPCPSAPLDSVDDLAGDPGVWRALESLEKAAGLATGVRDGMECARGHLRATALLAVLEGVDGEEGGGNSTAPWEQSPCFSEQLSGTMELGEAPRPQPLGEHGPIRAVPQRARAVPCRAARLDIYRVVTGH
jgi:hypothetical protein